MAGTKAGGIKAANTNKKRYGRDYYHRIGGQGGKESSTGGFFHAAQNDPDRHKEYSRRGGAKSRRRSNA